MYIYIMGNMANKNVSLDISLQWSRCEKGRKVSTDAIRVNYSDLTSNISDRKDLPTIPIWLNYCEEHILEENR